MCCVLFLVCGYVLLVGRCEFGVACCVLTIDWCSLFVVRCLLFAVNGYGLDLGCCEKLCCLLFVVWCSEFGVWCSLLAVCC